MTGYKSLYHLFIFIALISIIPQIIGFDGGIFKLPELVVHTNSTYLMRGVETRLECRIAGQPVEWANATLDRLLWLKDGMPISEGGISSVNSQPNDFIFERSLSSKISGMILRIVQASHINEGEYQCSAIVRQINVAPQLTIDSRLVSTPLKLRRARITKFERYDAPIVRVRQGQVARLACYGIPDVIPGPPELWFEKYGHEGVALGRTGNERFIVTSSGLQIAITQPSDAGRYFCIVRNIFTNQTRRAPRPIVLVVEPRIYPNDFALKNLHGNIGLDHPRIIYPESLNYSEPIELHVVAGQTIILECVIWEAKVGWNRSERAMPAISLTDDRARIRQIWGNLRIRNVALEDAGDYICYGIAPVQFSSNSVPGGGASTPHKFESDVKIKYPRAIYRLIVHAPTTVRLMLAQQVSDKAWQISCYAHNLRYEIPMVYVNGLALIDAMEEMGVPPQTNFFTNPINVTLRASNPLAGSVQCISRPAMEEAEVYGNGLERGRAMNLYVDDRLNQRDKKRNQTILLTAYKSQDENWRKHSSTEHKKEKIKSEAQKKEQVHLQIQRPTAFVAADNSIRIQWSVTSQYEAELSRIQNFFIEMLQLYLGEKKVTSEWIVVDRVRSHVRALTLKQIRIDNDFQLRVTANFDNRSKLSSEPTEWMKMHNPTKDETKEIDEEELDKEDFTNNNGDDMEDNYIDNEQSLQSENPTAPTITRLQTVSHESILVAWNHSALENSHNYKINKKQKMNPQSIIKFIVTYEALDDDYSFAQNPQKLFELENDIRKNNKTGVEHSTNNIEGAHYHYTAKNVEVSSKSTEILLTELMADTDYKVTVVAENSAGQRSEPSKQHIARTYVVIDEVYDNGESSNIWWTKLRRDYLNLPDVSFKFEIMLGALCIAAIMLIVLCCLTVFRLCEWRRQARHRRDDSANQFFMETSSPTFSSPSSSSHRLRKRDRQLYHEPCYFSIKDPISELSPLGSCESTPVQKLSDNIDKNSIIKANITDDNGAEYISRKTLLASLDENSEKQDTNCIENKVKRPNLYGNADAQLDELLEDIYGASITTQEPNTRTISRNTTINNSNTLKRASSFQRQQSPSTLSNNGIHYNNDLAGNRGVEDFGVLTLKRRSPSPITLSTSMYGGGTTLMYESTTPRRLLQQFSSTQKNELSKLLRVMESGNNQLSSGRGIVMYNHNDNIKVDSTNLTNSMSSLPPCRLTFSNNKLFNQPKGPPSHVSSNNTDEFIDDNMPAMPSNNNSEAVNSIYSSRISLSNSGNENTMTYGHFQQQQISAIDFDNFTTGDDSSSPYGNHNQHAAPSILSTFAASTAAAGQMSTFKSSGPSSGSSSSGYNSYSGSGGTLSITGNTNFDTTENGGIYQSGTNGSFMTANTIISSHNGFSSTSNTSDRQKFIATKVPNHSEI